MNTQCIVLNADFNPINVITWKRAIALLLKEKAEAIVYSDESINSASNEIRLPLIIRLVELVRNIYKKRVPFTKTNLFVRDGKRCMYCGTTSGTLTIDHVVPKSHGGARTFENCVTACLECNSKKGNRPLDECGLTLHCTPEQPTILQFIQMKYADTFEKIDFQRMLHK